MKEPFLSALFDNQPLWSTILITILSSLVASFWYLADLNKEIALLQSSYADIAQDHQELSQSVIKLNDKIDHQDDKIDSLYIILLENQKKEK